MPPNVIIKPRKVYSNYCTLCKSFLTGFGSVSAPYKCLCGVYRYNYSEMKYELGEKL